jgi:hypothetical protein
MYDCKQRMKIKTTVIAISKTTVKGETLTEIPIYIFLKTCVCKELLLE